MHSCPVICLLHVARIRQLTLTQSRVWIVAAISKPQWCPTAQERERDFTSVFQARHVGPIGWNVQHQKTPLQDINTMAASIMARPPYKEKQKKEATTVAHGSDNQESLSAEHLQVN